LKEIYIQHNEIIEKINKNNTKIKLNNFAEIITQLNIAFEFLQKSNLQNQYYSFAYISYFQIFEIIINQLITSKEDKNDYIYVEWFFTDDNKPLYEYRFEKGRYIKEHSMKRSKKNYPSYFDKIFNIAKKIDLNDDFGIIFFKEDLDKTRNNFIHFNIPISKEKCLKLKDLLKRLF